MYQKGVSSVIDIFPQEILRLSIDNLDYDKFVECLDKGRDEFTTETLYDTDCVRTMFERVCQLPGADRFIKVCIVKYGADVNKVSILC